jgi:magnesium transporter
MNRIKRQSDKLGLSPGSYIFLGKQKQEKVEINLMVYNEESFDFNILENIDDVLSQSNTDKVTWINIYGLHETDILKKIEEHFNIHLLIMEDILNTNQRPKIEIHDDYIFIVTKMIYFDDEKYELDIEQVSLILHNNHIICFQEKTGDFFNPLRERIKSSMGRIRKCETDYLAYAILDMIVDNYFLVLEKLGDEIEELDEEITSDSEPELAKKINVLKRTLIYFRKSIWPLREVINSITRDEIPYFKKKTIPFLRDLYDHIIQVIDTTESYREIVTGLLDMYMTSISNRMNEVMKVLTIIATIFIPLSFLAGVYGMNFDTRISPFNMPELHYKYGYIFFWFLVILIGGGLLLFFKKKKWL